MKKWLSVTLGIVAALGGFVDIGDLVFNAQAGARFGYSLLWALLVGTAGIMIYGEMSGRVVAVTKKTTFDLIRNQYPPKLGFFTLVVSLLLSLLTCAAEIGGLALVLALFTGYSYELLIGIGAIGLILVIWVLPFQGIEKVFGYIGVCLAIFVVVAIKTLPGGHELVAGLVPHGLSGQDMVAYAYFAVGIIAATAAPYEVYFYSSGGVEEKWRPPDAFVTNRMNALVGFALGGIVAGGIMITAANILLPHGIQPETLGTTALTAGDALGKAGLIIALLGMLFAIGGAAVEIAFSGAYNLSQYAGWRWGKHLPPLKVPRFTGAWLLILLAAVLIILTGIDPVQLTEYAVIFSVVITPLTYFPIWRAARDEKQMGKYKLGKIMSPLSSVYLVLITIVAVAAIPLMIATNSGQS